MNRKMGFFVAIMVFLFSICSFVYGASSEKTVMRINGTLDGRKEKDSAWTPIFTSRNLTDGDWAKTGLDSLAKIYIGGDRHFVKLYENTMVEISKVELKNENLFIQLKQILGRIKVNFDKYSGKTQTMEVNTPTATLAVRGTSFFSWVLRNGQTIVRVVSGVVRVAPTGGGMPFQVQAGQAAVISPPVAPPPAPKSSTTSTNTTSSSTTSEPTTTSPTDPSTASTVTTSDAHTTTPTIDVFDAPTAIVYDMPPEGGVASSSLINDQITYKEPGQPVESTSLSDVTTSNIAETTATGELSTYTTTSPTADTSTNTTTTNSNFNSIVQSNTSTGNIFSQTFDASFTNNFKNANINGIYDFSFSQKFSSSNCEGKIFVNISKPTLDPNKPNLSATFQNTVYAETNTIAPAPNIDEANSKVAGTLSYSRTGITPQDTFTIGLNGTLEIKINDPSQPFAAFFDVPLQIMQNFFDAGGSADIGGDIVDPTTAQNTPALLQKLLGKTQGKGQIVIKVRNPYTLPINGFGQSH